MSELNNSISDFKKENNLEILQSKEIMFTCKDQFAYDEITKKYYTDNRIINLSFMIKNVDKNFISDESQDVDDKIKVEYDLYYTRTDSYYTTTLNINSPDMIITYDDNNCYVSITQSFADESYIDVGHVICKIYSDTGNGIRVKDEMTLYFADINEFDYTLEYDSSFESVYLRKLKGNFSRHIPTKIDVFVNNMKTSPVYISNQNQDINIFKKDLYLNDGYNKIKVIATNICGNQNVIEKEVYVDCMPVKPEKENLLNNFIADDDLKISLHLGNADLEYETKSAGMGKNILLNTSIDSHYFKLSGENSHLYRISKNEIPKIEGDIVKRPLGIVFDSVEKIYDGTNDISLQIRKLNLDDGYHLVDIHDGHNNYSNSGLVRGTFERKVTSDVIAKANDYICTEYLLDKPNIDFSTIYINIDGIEGYALNEPDNNKANIILQNDSLNNIFESIDIIRNADRTSSLKFTYVENIELRYNVKLGVIIKYNYSNTLDLEQVVYKSSDVGMIKIDFENAFFETKNVTDTNQMITINNMKFIGDVLGDVSNNYQIANYSSTGRILKRTINPHIECLSKVYDGSPIMPFKMNDEYYHGLQNSIELDDVYIDTTFEGDRTSETHFFTNTGSTVIIADNPNVGKNKNVTISDIVLEGYDAKNYKIGQTIVSNTECHITKRPINIVINKVRLIRATRQWEIDYYFINDIATDKLTIVYNNENLDIKVYGGIDSNGESIHTSYDNIIDIIPMYFNYPFTTEYQFQEETEIQKINNETAYWKNKARPAEPDTERLDIISEIDNDYPGEIKHTVDTLSNGVQTSYFESQNKEYKLYSGCKVMVTNINLNPLNDKSNNYMLLNSTCETEIEII